MIGLGLRLFAYIVTFWFEACNDDAYETKKLKSHPVNVRILYLGLYWSGLICFGYIVMVCSLMKNMWLSYGLVILMYTANVGALMLISYTYRV